MARPTAAKLPDNPYCTCGHGKYVHLPRPVGKGSTIGPNRCWQHTTSRDTTGGIVITDVCQCKAFNAARGAA